MTVADSSYHQAASVWARVSRGVRACEPEWAEEWECVWVGCEGKWCDNLLFTGCLIAAVTTGRKALSIVAQSQHIQLQSLCMGTRLIAKQTELYHKTKHAFHSISHYHCEMYCTTKHIHLKWTMLTVACAVKPLVCVPLNVFTNGFRSSDICLHTLS